MAIKLFISQPMSGRTDAEIIDERNDAIASVMERFPGEEIDVIDSFFKDAPHDAHPLWFLGESIKLLGEADVAYFCKGWEDAGLSTTVMWNTALKQLLQ